MNQSDKIDQLLSKIAEEIEYSQESAYNFNTENESTEYRKLIIILMNENLISKTFNNATTFHITSHGQKVLDSGGWNAYQKKEKEKEERAEKKERLDLKISEFQVKTKWLPYWISFISLIISLFAYFKNDEKQSTKKVAEKEIPKKIQPKDTIRNQKEKTAGYSGFAQ